MTATCTNCETTFENVDRNEDGSPCIENEQCAQGGCDVYLCKEGCAALSFACEDCRKSFCAEHRITLDGLTFCPVCAIAYVEAQEPECECRMTDGDLFDACGCKLHSSESAWNARLRAVSEMGRYREAFHDAA